VGIAFVIVAAVLLGLVMTYAAIHVIRPAVFKISATATKWFSVTLEVRSPAKDKKDGT
jgi:hypothetical protein